MHKSFLLSICAIAISATSAAAQDDRDLTWPEDEQAVWSTIQGVYAAIAAGDFDSAREMIHEDALSWNGNYAAPFSREKYIDFVQLILEGREIAFESQDPVGISIIGDTATVYYHTFTVFRRDGSIERDTGSCFDVLVRDGRQWLFAGGRC